MKTFPAVRSTALAASLLLSIGCADQAEEPAHTVIPAPASLVLSTGEPFVVADSTRIVHPASDIEAERLARFLSDLIGNDPETRPLVVPDTAAVAAGVAHIRLLRTDGETDLGPEAYALDVSATEAVVRARGSAGLFYGIQTLRHLLPPVVEYQAAYPQPLSIPAVRITDEPRYEWRGFMLDVSRHFLEVDDVKRFIDLASLYKLNRLHLHLSDDQGWRIEIPGWPRLTEHGGQTEVGGGEGGFYTLEEYGEIVAYAAERYMTVVPEIDMPGHTNAALSSYAQLNCDDQVTDVYVGTEVGFSALCVEREEVYAFLDDVIRELAAVTPGPYIHIGGDEVRMLSEEQYITFIERVQDIVASHGKQMLGWDEIAFAALDPGAAVQIWRPFWGRPVPDDSAYAAHVAEAKDAVKRAVAEGARVVLSPSNRIYLDLKYDSATALGLTWAGIPDVRDAYDWLPSETFGELPAEAILGVEAPLWSETLATVEDFEYMAFPRLAGVAEIGWSPERSLDWGEYRLRLGAQSARWTALGVNFRRSPLVPWHVGPKVDR